MFSYVISPLDQFEIKDFFSVNWSILGLKMSLTNFGYYLFLSTIIILVLHFYITCYSKLISDSWSLAKESIYATVHSVVINQINSKEGQKYFPFIYVLFIFILINNLIGLIPYSFSTTSHFIITFFISFTVVLGATILGFQKHQLKFFSLFVPSGCPLGLLPLLVLIELISYLARNISLGLRLSANCLSGHLLLTILSDFTFKIMSSGFIFFILSVVPLAIIFAFACLELGIAFIQAIVFIILTSSYIKDALELH